MLFPERTTCSQQVLRPYRVLGATRRHWRVKVKQMLPGRHLNSAAEARLISFYKWGKGWFLFQIATKIFISHLKSQLELPTIAFKVWIALWKSYIFVIWCHLTPARKGPCSFGYSLVPFLGFHALRPCNWLVSSQALGRFGHIPGVHLLIMFPHYLLLVERLLLLGVWFWFSYGWSSYDALAFASVGFPSYIICSQITACRLKYNVEGSITPLPPKCIS